MRRIGIDVGGTNTDAVLLEDGRVVHAVKTPTTAEVTTGIVDALARLISHPEVAAGTIDGVMIGTTHFVNAVVQRRDLSRVAAVRTDRFAGERGAAAVLRLTGGSRRPRARRSVHAPRRP
jgi:N-methylhydantoinase A/oxoprolinase/acetone carboxylase beta subunit